MQKQISSINDIDVNKLDGRYLMAALAVLTTKVWTDKTPEQCIALLKETVDHMYDDRPLVETSEQQIKPEDIRYSLIMGLIHYSNACNEPPFEDIKHVKTVAHELYQWVYKESGNIEKRNELIHALIESKTDGGIIIPDNMIHDADNLYNFVVNGIIDQPDAK